MAEKETLNEPSTSRGCVGKRDELLFLECYVKQDITDALKVCRDQLESLMVCEGNPSPLVSMKAKLMGAKMAEIIIDMLKEFDFHEEFHSFLPEEECLPDLQCEPMQTYESSPEKSVSECSSSTSLTSKSESDYEPPNKKMLTSYVSLESKIKIANIAREHPKWSLKTIQSRGGRALK